MTFISNRLNSYETYTYNIALYMVHPSRTHELDKPIKDGNAVLIVDNSQENNGTESQFNITRMEQALITAYSETRSTISSQFEIEITEPNGGGSLMPLLSESATKLGIPDYLRAHFILGIRFIGRDANGSIRKHSTEFYYPVSLVSVNFELKSEGTVYFAKAIEVFVEGYMYLSGVQKDQITVEAKTVGKFIEELERKINLSSTFALDMDENRLYRNIYKFEFTQRTEEWKKWIFQQLTGDELNKLGDNIIIDEDGERKLQVGINNGSSIPEIIGMMLRLTEEYKKIPTHDGGFMREEGPDKSSTKNLDTLPVFYRVYPRIRFLKYDVLSGDYQKEITYIIDSYIVSNEVIDGKTYRSIIDNSAQKKRVNNYRDLGLLRKRYDYLYTGQNTEVINLDLKFDYVYFRSTPYGGGKLGDPNIDTSVAGKDKNVTVTRLREAKKVRADLARRSQTGKPSNQILFDPEEQRIADLDRQSLAEREYAAELNLQRLLSNYNPSVEQIANRIRFGSEVTPDSSIYGPESDLSGGVVNFGSVQHNLHNTGDLLTIEMQIKGDPYWLGKPRQFTSNDFQGSPSNDVADFIRGNNLFFLRVNFPVGKEDSTGRRKPSSNYKLSGLYAVVHVISNYQEGQFTQHLKAFLDVGTNSNSILKELEAMDIR